MVHLLINNLKRTNNIRPTSVRVNKALSIEEKKKFKETLDKLFGTRGACIFDQKLNILGKVPLTELKTTVKSLKSGIHALALDGAIDNDLVKTSEKLGVKFLIGTSSSVKGSERIKILTDKQLTA